MTDASLNPYQTPQAESSSEFAPPAAEYVLTGCLSVDDWLSARRLATRGFWPKATLVGLTLITFSLVLVAVAVSSRPYAVGASNVILFVSCIFIPGLMVVPYVLGRLRLRRLAHRQLGIFAPTHSTFSFDTIVSITEHAKVEMQWESFSHCLARDNVAIIFYRNSPAFMILARQKLQDPADWDALMRLVQTRLAGNSGSKPVAPGAN